MMTGGGSGAGLMDLRGDTPTGGTAGGSGAATPGPPWYCLAGLLAGIGIRDSPLMKKDIFVSINCKKVIIPTIDTFCKKLKQLNQLVLADLGGVKSTFSQSKPA